MADKSPKRKNTKGIQVTVGPSGFPQVPLRKVQVIERPKPGCEQEVLFFNPRNSSSFKPDSMAELRQSIRTDELLDPIVVRAVMDGDIITAIQLLAGERRVRTLLQILDENLACYSQHTPIPAKWRANSTVLYLDKFARVLKQTGDKVEIELWDADDTPTGENRTVSAEELLPTLPANKIYTNVDCKIFRNCSDSRAMRIAMTENNKTESLTTAEEIMVTERLVACDKWNQEEIAYMLAKSGTWVSHTLALRHQLPPDAFAKVIDNTMMRSVAIKFLSFNNEDRDPLVQSAIEVEKQETAEQLQKHQLDFESAEDEADILKYEADKASVAGDEKTAKQKLRKSSQAIKKSKVSKKKKGQVEKDSGKINETHVHKGAVKAGLKPKKAKMLPKGDVQQCFVDNVDLLLEGDEQVMDPICDQPVPQEVLMVSKSTALAILGGQRDVLEVIRDVMLERGVWALPCTELLDEDEFDPDAYEEDEAE